MIDGIVTGKFGGARAFTARLETVENYADDLVARWAAVLVEDNRRGILAGLDKDDRVMFPTSYRTSYVQAGRTRAGYVKSAYGYAVNVSGGPGPGFKPGPAANLRSSEYRKMTGPPLAPRGEASRVISNYTVAPVLAASGEIGVQGGWDDVVDRRGRPFLKYHFSGTGMHRGGAYASWARRRGVGRGKNLPRRNIAGLRDWGRKQARKELREWIAELTFWNQPEYFASIGHTPDFVAEPAWMRRRRNRGNP